MKLFAAVVLYSILCQALAGPWTWFSRSQEAEIIPAAEDISDECLNHQTYGSCSFYDCIENRFPCLENGYTEKVSKHFCARVDAAFYQFDAVGQIWLNKTSICLMRQLDALYRRDSVTCQDVKDAGIEAIIFCNEQIVTSENGQSVDFCRFLQTNNDQYTNLMGVTELRLLASLRDARVWTSMISQAMTCGVYRLSETIGRVGESLTNLLGSLTSRISGFFN